LAREELKALVASLSDCERDSGSLSLRRIRLGDQGLLEFVDLLERENMHTLPGVESLDLSRCDLADVGLCAFVQRVMLSQVESEESESSSSSSSSLACCSSLCSLNLSKNSIGDDGVKALALAIGDNSLCCLRRLDLRFNDSIGDDGCLALAEALIANESVETLLLGGDEIGPLGAIALAEMLKFNETLTQLHLDSERIGKLGFDALTVALESNTTLVDLNCQIDDDVGDVDLSTTLEPISDADLSRLNKKQEDAHTPPPGTPILSQLNALNQLLQVLTEHDEATSSTGSSSSGTL
jgi:Leucine Rich repeat